MTSPIDLATMFSATLLQNVQDQFTEFGLDMPGQIMQTAGQGVPLQDCCDGILFSRVDTVYPSGGDGNPFAQARIDFDLPAWVYPIHIGFLWCHSVIEEDGDAVDPAEETAYAQRDGIYRGALLLALQEKAPAALQPYANGYRLNPWMPLGPDGGCSGGSLVVNILSNHLVLMS